MEEDNSEIKKRGKVWLGEDGIIRVKGGKDSDLDAGKRLAGEVANIAKTLKTKAKVLIDARYSKPKLDILFRKGIVQIFLDAYRDPGFEKIVFWGFKNKSDEIIGSFIINAVGLKNIKIFKTEEEALKWIKEE